MVIQRGARVMALAGLLSLLVIVPLFDASGSPTESWKEADRIVIVGLSTKRLFTFNLSPEGFDEYLRTQGADYELVVHRDIAIAKFGELIERAESVGNTPVHSIDIRCRVAFMRGAAPVLTLYSDAFGQFAKDDRVLRLTNGKLLMRELGRISHDDGFL